MQSNNYSLEAERSVIGGLLLEPSSIDAVREIVTDSDFFRPEHCHIFGAFSSLTDSGEACDVVTVGEHLDKNGLLEIVGGTDYLIDLATNAPSTSNITSYAQIVRERSTLRAISNAAESINGQTVERDGLSSSEILHNAEGLLSQISDGGAIKLDYRMASDVLTGTIDRIDELFHSDSAITGLSTGLSDLDEMTLGLQDQDLIILGGRPSSGKTSCGMNIAENAAINEGKTVAVFSLEMPAEQLLIRSLSSVGRIDQKVLRTGDLQDQHWSSMIMATKKIKDSKLLIDDTAGIGPAEMRSKLRRMVRDHGEIGLILVDYLQLMRIAGFTEGRTQEISEISRSLKSIAKEFGCPLIALSQLNRGLEQRPNKRPINSDLRESGSIEQDADVIMFIYRDEVYNEDSPDKGIAEIIIGKQRNGPIGTCRTAFIGQYTRFEDLAPQNYSEY